MDAAGPVPDDKITETPPVRAARLSSRSPPRCFIAPWHLTQWASKIGLTSLRKSTGAAGFCSASARTKRMGRTMSQAWRSIRTSQGRNTRIVAAHRVGAKRIPPALS